MAHNHSRPWSIKAAAVVIATVSLSVVIPFIWLGIPSGHDFEFHFNSWIEVTDHWKQGFFYPHWAALAHYGYGEARFIFYPPISWTFGAALGTILPWKFVPAAYIWVVLALAGCSMFLLARRWLERCDAIFVAALYAANPYHLVIVYWRSAMAELIAAAYLPLLLLWMLRSETEEGGLRIVLPWSLLMAAVWLTNLPAAVMMNYSIAVLALFLSIWRGSFSTLAYAALAVGIGAGLAGFYLLPAYHEQSWVNIGEVLGPGVRPVDNFLFTATADPDHNRFNRLASMVAFWEIAMLAVMLFLSRRSRTQKLWWALLVWGGLCTALMFRPTLPLWMHLPELRFVQIPWRWLLCLNVPFTLLMALGFRRWWFRAAVCIAGLAVILLVWTRVQSPWWDNRADIREMLDNQQDGIGNEGADEYVPAGVDPYDIDQKAPPARIEGQGQMDAEIRIQDWQAEKRLLLVRANSSGRLILRLFNYPLWQARVNGKLVHTQTRAHTGEMVVPITSGVNQIQIDFVEGWDRKLGLAISFVSWGVLFVAFLMSRIVSRRTRSSPAALATSSPV